MSMAKLINLRNIGALFAAPISIIGLSVLLFISATSVHAAGVTITSPTNGQEFSGNDFTVSGQATPDATVVIIRNGLTLTSTIANNSGAWQAQLNDLPDGPNTITAREIKNGPHVYFVSSPDSGTTYHINRLRLSDNVMNDSSPYPITTTIKQLMLVPSPTTSDMMFTGNFFASDVLGKFNSTSPADPIATTGFANNLNPSVGAFSADGTQYFSPNSESNSVGVVNVETNALVDSIQMPGNTAGGLGFSARGANNRIYVPTFANDHVVVFDGTTHTILADIDTGCSGSVPTVTVSQDEAYPYFYLPCAEEAGDNRILKYSVETNELVASWPVEQYLTNGILTLDNARLYMTSSAASPNSAGFADKLFVYDTTTGQQLKTVNLTGGALGIAQSPDGQHIYAATPGTFNHTGIDIVDIYNDDSITTIDTGDEIVPVVITSPASAAITNVNLSVVLGVSTATAVNSGSSAQLAKTGAFVALASPIGLFLVGAAIYTYTDYRRHKLPLTEAAADANYSYFHHLKVVTIPLARYRLSVGVERKVDRHSDEVRRF
mgnify:CR=1 FL=1